ncbi:transposase [Salinibacter ruber]|uniref:transposase n=1 Tax=Salinibacter ruber TaxID=146919 RepID=UPI003C6E003F
MGEKGIEALCTIPCINRWSAAILRSEIGPIDRFDSAKELVAYVGLGPRREESGDCEASWSISKRESPRVRAILYTCTSSAAQHNPPVKALYERLTGRGKHRMLHDRLHAKTAVYRVRMLEQA